MLGVGEALGAAGLSVHGDSPFLTTWCARHPTLALSSGDQKAQWVLSGPCPSEGSVGICSMTLSSFWALGSPWCPGLVAALLQPLHHHHHEASPKRLCLFPSDEDTGQIGVGPPCPSVTSPQLNYICSDPVPKEVTLRGSGKNGTLGAHVQPSTVTCHPELGCPHGVCRFSPSLVHVQDEVPNRGKRGCSGGWGRGRLSSAPLGGLGYSPARVRLIHEPCFLLRSRRPRPCLQRKRGKRPRRRAGVAEREARGSGRRTSASAVATAASWCCATAGPALRPTTCPAWAWASGPSVGPCGSARPRAGPGLCCVRPVTFVRFAGCSGHESQAQGGRASLSWACVTVGQPHRGTQPERSGARLVTGGGGGPSRVFPRGPTAHGRRRVHSQPATQAAARGRWAHTWLPVRKTSAWPPPPATTECQGDHRHQWDSSN